MWYYSAVKHLNAAVNQFSRANPLFNKDRHSASMIEMPPFEKYLDNYMLVQRKL
jgi:hypothetical protein